VSLAVIEEHLAACDSCREFAQRAEMPDLMPRIASADEHIPPAQGGMQGGSAGQVVAERVGGHP